MDAHTIPVSGTNPQYTPAAPKAATDTAPAVTAQAAEPQIIAKDATDTSVPEASQYEASLRQAALSFKNVYAVSDQQLSIFKDATGKYITRYVSLRDGKVTYLPEPVLVKQLQLGGENSPARIAISA